MYALADTEKLVADDVISAAQAKTIEIRARDTMLVLGINILLFSGILSATAGLIFWLADAKAVAISGTLALIVGMFILTRGGDLFRMFGNAAALIGAGMLIGGASVELLAKYADIAGWVMIISGAAIVAASGWGLTKGNVGARFVIGAILLMGLVTHLVGIGFLLQQQETSGLPVSVFYLYATAAVVGAGWATNVRVVTALAILPFAQALDVGTIYLHAIYGFYSPESTLSILQMSVLIGLCVWAVKALPERMARHARVLAVMAFVIANLCALVGSLWGDVVGETIWGPGYWRYADGRTWAEWREVREAFELTALVISEGVYSVVWAAALAIIVFVAARGNQRGLFNTALVFGAIHAYTQLFESFADEPLAYVIGGLVAIPLAWGMWRLDHWLTSRTPV